MSSTLQEWSIATNIRLKFLRPKTTLGHLLGPVARQDPTIIRRASHWFAMNLSNLFVFFFSISTPSKTSALVGVVCAMVMHRSVTRSSRTIRIEYPVRVSTTLAARSVNNVVPDTISTNGVVPQSATRLFVKSVTVMATRRIVSSMKRSPRRS